MRTYYDPEDDSFCDKTDRHERLLDLADHLARALLTRCFHLMTGREINACQIATGDYDTDEGFNATIIDLLAIQFSREISEHINQNNQ
jgi:hypothetical protein